MTALELVLNMLAEATTVEISKQKAPETFSGNIDVARAGGKAAGDARKAIESQTGVPVITSKNAAQLNQVVTDLLEGATTSPEKQALIHWQQNLWAITKRKTPLRVSFFLEQHFCSAKVVACGRVI